jgi:hypothetical protein
MEIMQRNHLAETKQQGGREAKTVSELRLRLLAKCFGIPAILSDDLRLAWARILHRRTMTFFRIA